MVKGQIDCWEVKFIEAQTGYGKATPKVLLFALNSNLKYKQNTLILTKICNDLK